MPNIRHRRQSLREPRGMTRPQIGEIVRAASKTIWPFCCTATGLVQVALVRLHVGCAKQIDHIAYGKALFQVGGVTDIGWRALQAVLPLIEARARRDIHLLWPIIGKIEIG